MPSVDSGQLTDSEWTRHQQIIAGFESAWRRGDRPKIAAYLPADEPRRFELLVELVHADLEFRIKAGESARVEEYLRRYPSLTRARETVLGLIRAECSIRRRREPGLKLDRYRRRFPGYLADLETPAAEASTVTAPADPPKEPAQDSPSVAELPLPRRLGKYELRQKLGSGSFGVVYRAWDAVMHREVAIKVPRPEVVAAQGDLKAFLREARNAVELNHPHIVPILDAGPIGGIECIVRHYVDGITLAERLREGPITPEESATLMAMVADAIDHAHQRGIIHRDLKPSNILLDVRGLPHVSDFGLAKRESGDTTLSPVGSPGPMIGTPAYMSPEQARGETYLVDARSDVYSLGVVLYEVLTGALPFHGRGRMLQVQIQEAEPLAPRSLNDEVPPDLETICLKALAKDPQRRYPSARAMADDLHSFLEGEPVGAGPGPIGRTPSGAWWRSPRALARSASWLVLTLAMGSTTALWLRADARRARDAEGLELTYRALLDLAGSARTPGLRDRSGPLDSAWERAKGLAFTLGGDPALIEIRADALLGLAERAELEGSDRASGPSWLRAVGACEASIRERTGQPGRLGDLALAAAKLGEIRARANDPAGARKLFDRSILLRSEALELLEGRSTDHPLDDNQVGLGEGLMRLAEARKRTGETAEVHRVASIAEDLARRSWSLAVPVKRRLARLLLDLSRWQLADGQPGPGLESATRSLRLYRESGPPDADSEAGAARSCLALAEAGGGLGRESEAVVRSAEAVDQFEELVQLHPVRLEDRLDLARALLEAGRLIERSPDRAGATAHYLRSLRVRLDLDRDHPGSHTTLARLAETRAALARVSEADGRWPLAIGYQTRAILDQARAVALAPGEAAYRNAFGQGLKELMRIIRDTPNLVASRSRFGAFP